MRTITLTLATLLSVFALVACSDTKDCVCEYTYDNNTSKAAITGSVVMSDWDEDCSDITAEDLEQNNATHVYCSEQ